MKQRIPLRVAVLATVMGSAMFLAIGMLIPQCSVFVVHAETSADRTQQLPGETRNAMLIRWTKEYPG